MAYLNTNLGDAITAYTTHGVYRQTLQWCLENQAEITESFRDCLSSYYLKYWSGKYFLQSMKEGIIVDQNTPYHIVFAHGLSRGKILRSDSLTQYRLSFRKARPAFNLPAFVFVSYP